jgi:hypothetical protein
MTNAPQSLWPGLPELYLSVGAFVFGMLALLHFLKWLGV